MKPNIRTPSSRHAAPRLLWIHSEPQHHMKTSRARSKADLADYTVVLQLNMKLVIWPSFPLLLMLIDGLASSPTSIYTTLSQRQINHASSRTSSDTPRFILERRDPPPHLHNSFDIEDLGAGWIAISHEFQAILPVDIAADTIANFYHSIVSMCTAMVAQGAPLVPQGGTFRLGDLQLAVDSTGSPVTWNLIRAFADWMMLIGDRGFTGCYTFWLTNYASGQAIRFRFYPRQI